MAIAFGGLLTSGYSATGNMSSASVTPTAGNVTVIALYLRNNTATGITVSGCNLTWTKQTITNYSGTEYYIFTGVGNSPSAGSITSSGGNGGSSALWVIQHFSGVDTTSPLVQSNYATSTSTAPSVTLSSSILSGNTAFGFCYTRNQPTFTAGSGYTLIGSANEGAGARTIETEYQLNYVGGTVVNMTINNSQVWAMLGMELAQQSTASSTGNWFLMF